MNSDENSGMPETPELDDSFFRRPILTRPGESMIDKVQASRRAAPSVSPAHARAVSDRGQAIDNPAYQSKLEEQRMSIMSRALLKELGRVFREHPYVVGLELAVVPASAQETLREPGLVVSVVTLPYGGAQGHAPSSVGRVNGVVAQQIANRLHGSCLPEVCLSGVTYADAIIELSQQSAQLAQEHGRRPSHLHYRWLFGRETTLGLCDALTGASSCDDEVARRGLAGAHAATSGQWGRVLDDGGDAADAQVDRGATCRG